MKAIFVAVLLIVSRAQVENVELVTLETTTEEPVVVEPQIEDPILQDLLEKPVLPEAEPEPKILIAPPPPEEPMPQDLLEKAILLEDDTFPTMGISPSPILPTVEDGAKKPKKPQKIACKKGKCPVGYICQDNWCVDMCYSIKCPPNTGCYKGKCRRNTPCKRVCQAGYTCLGNECILDDPAELCGNKPCPICKVCYTYPDKQGTGVIYKCDYPK